MSRKVSEAMLKAQRVIIETGCSAYAAAKQCGITTKAITVSDWYKDRKEEGLTHAQGRRVKPEQMELAKKLVMTEGKTSYAAAKQVGIAQSTITRAAWYKTFKQTE